MKSLRDLFLLDPDVVFFNHGSFGATPRQVFDKYQFWQREMERNPVKFIQRQLNHEMEQARADLGAYLHTNGENLIYVANATFAMNVVIRSLNLGPDDEVLTTDHEYGAINNTWHFMADKLGYRYINHPMPQPMTTHEEFVEKLWQGVTPKTRVISISHITSPTALIFPVAEICKRAREAGIVTVVDGAHAPGQIALNLDEMGVDYYAGNCHKWLCSPKGAGFLYTHPDRQSSLEPLVVSHGWRKNEPDQHTYVGVQQYQGTRDLAAFLAVPEAIRFQREHNWDQVSEDCHQLAGYALSSILERYDLTPNSPVDADPRWWQQMVSIPLPPMDVAAFSKHLMDDLHVEIPVGGRSGRPGMRLSIQGYNTKAEVDMLLDVIDEYTNLFKSADQTDA